MVEHYFTSSAVPQPLGSRAPFSELVEGIRLSGAVVALEGRDVVQRET